MPSQVALLDAQPGDGSGDHQLLDLLSSFEDVEGLIWTSPLIADVDRCAL